MAGDAVNEAKRPSLLRDNEGGHASVGYAELFFDLVYVFAITQLSHYLLAHHDLIGVLQTLILFLAVWWAWSWMAWATNWVDPERGPVRMMIFLVMLAGLAMSASVPKAFAGAGLVFAIAYLAMQMGRTAWLCFIFRKHRPALANNLARALIWFLAFAPLWIIGALSEPQTQLILWGAALGLNYLAPATLFWVPGMGASRTTDFGVSGHHMAERCALFLIIALGEGILLTGATFADMKWDGMTVAAFATAFAGSVAMWWVYFDLGSRRGADHIEHHSDSGRVARDAFTYGHIPIVAGIIISAVADEMVLAHPKGHIEPLYLWAAVGGPALFLLGTMIFKKMTSDRPWWPFSHIVGLGLFGLVALWGLFGHPSPLTLMLGSVTVLLIVAIWEWGSFHGGWLERGIPVPRTLRERAQQRAADYEASKAAKEKRD